MSFPRTTTTEYLSEMRKPLAAMRSFFFSLIAIFAPSKSEAENMFTLAQDPPKLASPAINEASGLAVSSMSDSFFWIINDSGGKPEIFLCNTDGTSRGAITIKGAKNRDWEDLSSFTVDGKPFLLVADTGDNQSQRDSVTLLIINEPSLPRVGQSVAGEVAVSWKIDFTFEYGPRDCEAVAVDQKNEKIVLISKRTNPPQVYELPLRPGRGTQVAKKIGTARTIAPALSFIPFRNQPTGLDISSDGSTAAVVTYYGVFLFSRKDGREWHDAFAEEPQRIGSHSLAQAESVAFTKDGQVIFAVSEGVGSPVSTFRK